jgi:hypothetical protein
MKRLDFVALITAASSMIFAAGMASAARVSGAALTIGRHHAGG